MMDFRIHSRPGSASEAKHTVPVRTQHLQKPSGTRPNVVFDGPRRTGFLMRRSERLPPKRLPTLGLASARQAGVRRPFGCQRSPKFGGAFPKRSPKVVSLRNRVDGGSHDRFNALRAQRWNRSDVPSRSRPPARSLSFIRPVPPSHLAVLHFTPHSPLAQAVSLNRTVQYVL